MPRRPFDRPRPRRQALPPCPRRLWALGLLCGAAGAAAQTVPATAPAPVAAEPLPTLAQCAAIGAPSDRLACYDRMAGRAPAATAAAAAPAAPATATAGTADTAAATPAAEAASDSPPTDSRLQATDTPPLGNGLRVERPSLLSAYWELDRQDKRGTFKFVGYRPNFVLPVHWTSRINRNPSSPTQATVQLPDYRNIEMKFQLSLRTKVLQDFGLPGGDLWLGFTQQAFWQIYNSQDSKPFRNTDYEPEILYVAPVPESMRSLVGGWQWRMLQAGLAHQSNGQSDPLSRSWNRVYLGTAVERGNWSATARIVHRIKEDSDDNNPDLLRYRGRWDLQVNWASGAHTASLLYRSTVRDVALGAVQLDWTYPVFSDQPNGIRWVVQLFHGYGETLTDYNFRQTSLGLGVSFLQF